MSERKTAMVRCIEYFESADLREARAAFSLAREVMEARMKQVSESTPFHKKRRTRKAMAGADTPSMSMEEQEANAAAAGASA